MTDTVLFDTTCPSVAVSGGSVTFAYATNIKRLSFSSAANYRYFRVTCARVGVTSQSYVVATVNTGDGIDSENRLSHSTDGTTDPLEGIVCTPQQTQTRQSDVAITGIDLACVGDPTLVDAGILATIEVW